MQEKAIHFPGLNGLRAIAALAVVISHTTLSLGEFGLNPHLFGTLNDGTPRGLSLAGYGVSIFFVLSGFLITYLLITEKKSQAIDIQKFYYRRILRIWPLYYLYLAIALILIFLCHQYFIAHSLWMYVFFVANIPLILHTQLPFLIHYWSLGVEEQYYVFWPWIVKYSKSLITVAISLFVLFFGTKVLLHLFYPGTLLEDFIQNSRFHCMMLGAIGSVWYTTRNQLFLKLCNNKLTQLVSWTVIVLLDVNRFHIASFIDQEIVSVVALCLIIGQIEMTSRIVNLEKPLFDFLGKISYGIYIIHPILIFGLSKIFVQLTIPPIVKYPLIFLSVLSSTILLAYLSYSLFERYFLKLKKRFEVVRSESNI